MPVIPHVVRRGAIYYWRKRLPRSPVYKSGIISVSLRTADPRRARFKAAKLTSESMAAFEDVRTGMLTPQQLQRLIQLKAQEIDESLTQQAIIDRANGGLPAVGQMGLNWQEHYAVMAEVARRRADMVDPNDPSHHDPAPLRHKGWTEAMIKAFMGLFPPPDFFGPRAFRDEQLKTLAERANIEIGAAPSEELLFALDSAALRGQAAAYEKHAQARASLADHDMAIAFPPQWSQPVAPQSPPVLTPAPKKTGLEDLINLLIVDKRTTGDWDAKAETQARQVFRLFTGHLHFKSNVEHLEDLTQQHLGEFDRLIKSLNPRHGKASEDSQLSAKNYIEKYTPPRSKHDAVLSPQTRNRYWVVIGQMLTHAKKHGHSVGHLDTSLFWTRKPQTDARAERKKPLPEQMRAFFSSPVFVGCDGFEDRMHKGKRAMHTAGFLTFHRAAYFVPIIMAYHGFRREEVCGLVVDDIDITDGIPIFKIRENSERRIKNATSKRDHAIHPEVLRLGFMDYVEKIRSLGYTRVFPDLVSASRSTPSGDRLYDELKPAFAEHGLTPHSFRHFFDNALKRKRVPEEFRGDLMGHKGKSETSNRYSDALEIQMQPEELAKIDDVTGHLPAMDITLLPWVEQKKPAPWARSATRGKGISPHPEAPVPAPAKRRRPRVG